MESRVRFSFLNKTSLPSLDDLAVSDKPLAFVFSPSDPTVSGAMYGSRLTQRLASIGYDPSVGGHGGSAVGNVNGLEQIEPPELSRRVVHAYARSLNDAWIISAPLVFVGFLVSFLLKQYSLDRKVVRAPARTTHQQKEESAATKKSTEDAEDAVPAENKKEGDSPV